MKKLPVGIQNLEEIINEGYVYVDKTSFAKTLIDTGKHYFLSRPRRFGKSLFLNTLKHIFLGNKNLFQNCSIYHSDYNWVEYPVLHFSFSNMAVENSESFEWYLRRYLNDLAAPYSLELKGPLSYCLTTLIKRLSQENKVVILVDEYDKPILDHLEEEKIAEGNRKILRAFFTTLKDMDEYLKFTFITGISRFSRASLFSGFNNLKDISLDDRFSDMMGYTQEEIERSFQEHVQSIAQQASVEEKKEISSEVIFNDMKSWYNGYLFSRRGKRVYNPFSTLSFLDTGEMASYWYNTGTPSFLIKQVAKVPQKIPSLSGIKLHAHALSDITDVNNMNVASLMFQTGYLTFQSYDAPNRAFCLDFPNREVREAFFYSLIEYFSTSPLDSFVQINAIRQAFESKNIKDIVDLINNQFSSIPYDLFKGCKESFFHAILEFSSLPTRSERHTHTGRIDLVVETKNIFYIVECKLDKTSKEAFQQIQEKNYLSPYRLKGKSLIALGLNFCSEKRCINEWKGAIYSSEGAFVSVLC